MPTDRDRAQQTRQWIREGRPTPWSYFSGGGCCIWILALPLLLILTFIVCSGIGHR